MAVKFGKAMGLEVTVISTSENKRKTAMELGATHFLSSKDEKSMQVRTAISAVLALSNLSLLIHWQPRMD
jgi:D-arabinose 1-dehydrogenase-like Zn-dependent alcohol dehydrogenase